MSGVQLIDRSSSEVTRATASKPLIAAAKAESGQKGAQG